MVPLVLAFLALPASPALAVKDEPLVLVTAWYWEDQTRQRIQDPTSGTDVAVISVPNPFCPSAPLAGSPPDEACHPGRLPVEVREADYEKPNKLSAVGFDLALVPPGSQVQKFTATFIEASDPQSEPVNAEGKSLQACFVEEFFGDGEAALYTEAPKYTCSETDPVAERKEIKTKEEGGGGGGGGGQEEQDPVFGYTFDLTDFAAQWVSEGSAITSVMLMPVRPKEADFDPATDANWRTVLLGNQEENAIRTSITYVPPKTPVVDTDPPPITTDPGSSFDPGSSVTTTDSGSVTPTTDSGVSTPTDTGDDAPAAPTDLAAEAEETGDKVSTGLPGYAWLAILAGIIGFNMVRSVVLESATGIRPDGVLAQIRRLNAARRGAPVAAEGPVTGGQSPFAAMVAGLKGLGEKLKFGKGK